jgi:predicted nucleic acid-binding protein
MLVVADTSALLALAACDSLPLLDALFEDVRVPGAVFRECTVEGKPPTDMLRTYLQGRVDDVDLTEFVVVASGLGRGELEAMALYKRLHTVSSSTMAGRGG